MFTEKPEVAKSSGASNGLFARPDSILVVAALAQHSPAGAFALWQLHAPDVQKAQNATPGLWRRLAARLFARKSSAPRRQEAGRQEEVRPALRDTQGNVVLMGSPRNSATSAPSANDATAPQRRRA
jgi:hypothetical protein